MFARHLFFGLHDPIGNQPLPCIRNSAEIGFVADFKIVIVVTVDFTHHFADELFLDLKQPFFRVGVEEPLGRNLTDTLDIILRIHGRELPLRRVINGAEKIQLQNNPELGGFLHQLMQPLKISGVELREVKFVGTVQRTGFLTSHPRRHIVFARRQRVVLNIEIARFLAIRAHENTGMIEPVFGKRFQVLVEIKSPIE